jgi:hypothetical protein
MPTQLIDRYGQFYDADNPLPIGASGGGLWTATATFTRPNDTTAYAVADAVANSATVANVQPLVFGGMGAALGGSGLITNILAWKANTAVVTNAAFRLYLMTARLTTAFGDNLAFNMIAADMPKVVAIHEFVLRTEGASSTACFALDDTRRFDYQCDGSDTSLFGYLAAEAAYTPTALDQFFIRLTARRDA